MNKTNNQIRREEFEKRRVYKGALSHCQAGYDCPIFMNCLLEINQLKKQLEEKDKVINEIKKRCDRILGILERGKNGNNKCFKRN